MKAEKKSVVEKVWPRVDYIPEATRAQNIKKWQAALEYLGDKWLLAKPVGRKV